MHVDRLQCRFQIMNIEQVFHLSCGHGRRSSKIRQQAKSFVVNSYWYLMKIYMCVSCNQTLEA